MSILDTCVKCGGWENMDGPNMCMCTVEEYQRALLADKQLNNAAQDRDDGESD